MEGSSLQASSHAAGGLWVVGCSALDWWALPPSIHVRHWHPGPKDTWVMRWEKTLALAQALHACAEESGAPPVFCTILHGSFRGVWLPLCPSVGDDIVKASLLKSTKEECGTSPTLEEEAILLGKETELQQTPGVEPAEQITASRSPSPPHAPWSKCCPSPRAKESVKRIDTDPNQPQLIGLPLPPGTW